MKIKTIEQARELGLVTFSYDNGDWEYQDENDYWHLFRDGEELLPDISKLTTWSDDNGDWQYMDGWYEWHKVKGSNNEN